ncbi:hypothetical protein E4U55_005154, partial [Claviceps digitariae]
MTWRSKLACTMDFLKTTLQDGLCSSCRYATEVALQADFVWMRARGVSSKNEGALLPPQRIPSLLRIPHGRIPPHEPHRPGRPAHHGAVPLHPRPLEPVAHDADPPGKHPEPLPEQRLAEEDVVERVERAVLQQDVLAGGRRAEQVEVAVLVGEVGVGLGFGEGGFGAGWCAG